MTQFLPRDPECFPQFKQKREKKKSLTSPNAVPQDGEIACLAPEQ